MFGSYDNWSPTAILKHPDARAHGKYCGAIHTAALQSM